MTTSRRAPALALAVVGWLGAGHAQPTHGSLSPEMLPTARQSFEEI